LRALEDGRPSGVEELEKRKRRRIGIRHKCRRIGDDEREQRIDRNEDRTERAQTRRRERDQEHGRDADDGHELAIAGHL